MFRSRMDPISSAEVAQKSSSSSESIVRMSQRHHPLVRILSSVVWWGAWIVMRSAGLAVLPHPARVRISPQSAHLVHRHDDQAVRPPVVPMAGVCYLDVDADT